MNEKTCAACDCSLDQNAFQITIGGRTVDVCCDDCAVRLKESHRASGAEAD